MNLINHLRRVYASLPALLAQVRTDLHTDHRRRVIRAKVRWALNACGPRRLAPPLRAILFNPAFEEASRRR